MEIGISAAARPARWQPWIRQGALKAAPLRRAITGVRARARQGGAGARRLPDLLIIGAQRAGTTSLYNYLVLHPDVVEPLAKEPNYFSIHWSRGEAWYRSHFPATDPGCHGRSLAFEASPYYLFHPLAAERAGGTVPEAKLIALLRDPVERAYSHYQHNVRRGVEKLSFADAIASEDDRLAGDISRMEADPTYAGRSHRLYSYAARGCYAGQLARWYQHFPPAHVLVVRSEDLYTAPATVFEEVRGFLGLDAWLPPGGFPNFSRSRAEADSAVPPDVRAKLIDTFSSHNAGLARLVSQDLSSWDY